MDDVSPKHRDNFMAIPGIKEDPYSLFQKTILDQTKEYPPPIPIINLIQNGDVFPILTRKSYSLWQGKQKSKKTTVLAIAIASMISEIKSTDRLRFECADPGVVIFFDCEQGESFAARTMKLILKLAKLETSQRLIYSDLRELSPSQRVETIKAGIEGTENVKLVVIDGVVDLMDDFMDAKEGHTIVTDLLKLCSIFNLHIAGVIHQNKGPGKEARAHVGSISSQKCEVEITAEVDPNDRLQSVISCKESRGLPFKDFAIRWDVGALPEMVQDWCSVKSSNKQSKVVSPGDVPLETHLLIVEDTFDNKLSMLRSILKQASQLNIKKAVNMDIGSNKTDEWINYWLDIKLICRTGKPGTRSAKYCRSENT